MSEENITSWRIPFPECKATLEIKNMIQERTIDQLEPSLDKVFRCFELLHLDNVKVVILGQDPYYNGQADGLAFSAKRNGRTFPASLWNIFKELQDDIDPNWRAGTSDLTPWVEQGVLLMNTSLTTVHGHANTHHGMWNPVIKHIFELLRTKPNLVYLLWGKNAQTWRHMIDETNNLVLVSSHPSPRSVRHSFFGSKPFSKTNEYLMKHNKNPIEWLKLKQYTLSTYKLGV